MASAHPAAGYWSFLSSLSPGIIASVCEQVNGEDLLSSRLLHPQRMAVRRLVPRCLPQHPVPISRSIVRTNGVGKRQSAISIRKRTRMRQALTCPNTYYYSYHYCSHSLARTHSTTTTTATTFSPAHILLLLLLLPLSHPHTYCCYYCCYHLLARTHTTTTTAATTLSLAHLLLTTTTATNLSPTHSSRARRQR